MEYINRTMGEFLRTVHDIFPVITLTGPRQSGKTTLCRHFYQDVPYINMESIQTANLFNEDPIGYINGFKNGVIIDEAQLQPEIFKVLQVIVDEDIHRGNDRHFIITGSSNFAIMARSAESMSGRTVPLTLLPLSTNEILESQEYVPSTSQLCFLGGYPKVWISPHASKDIIMQSYIDTYAERDLRQLLNIKDLNKFIKFLGLCAGRVGTELNLSSLSVEAGVTVATVDSWLSVLEASYIIWRLAPWSTNINKRLTKAHKLYFCDTGLLCTLLGIREEKQLEFYPTRGAIFENMVINNFVKAAYNAGRKPRLSFYRDKTGREIDLISETAEGLNLFEIKASAAFNPDFFKNIRYFEKTFPEKVVSASIIYDGPSSVSENVHSGIFNFRTPELYSMQ